MNRKIWLVSVNWDKLKETGSLYEWTCYCSYYEGEDISELTEKLTDKHEQIYLFTAKKRADNLEEQIQEVAKAQWSKIKVYN